MFILGMGIFSAIVPTIVAIVFEKWEAAIIWGIVAFFWAYGELFSCMHYKKK